MKLQENNYLMRWIFFPSFIRIGQKLWIFTWALRFQNRLSYKITTLKKIQMLIKLITDKNLLFKQNGQFCNITHQKFYIIKLQKKEVVAYVLGVIRMFLGSLLCPSSLRDTHNRVAQICTFLTDNFFRVGHNIFLSFEWHG